MKVNNSKNGRFKYKMIGETQPEIELLEVAAFTYPFPLKARSSILTGTKM